MSLEKANYRDTVHTVEAMEVELLHWKDRIQLYKDESYLRESTVIAKLESLLDDCETILQNLRGY